MVRYRPSQEVVVTYELVKDWTGQFVHPLQFNPVLMPDYLEITGDNALVYPGLEPGKLVTANFDWQAHPPHWILATSIGTSTGAEVFATSISVIEKRTGRQRTSSVTG